MRITILSAIFPPEPIISSKTSYSLAVGLVERNQAVKVITNFPNRPSGRLYKGYKRSLYSSENDPAGFQITRCFSSFSKESSMLSRWLENISFGLSSSLALLFSKKPDVVFSNTWPVFATGLTALVCKIRRLPLIVSIQDLYPESLAIQGRMKKNQWLYRFLFSTDKWIAQQADSIIVLTEDHALHYSETRRVNPSRVHIIPNWIDQDSIELADKNEFRSHTGISPDAFVLVYGGNIGRAAGVENLIKAMGELSPKRETVLVIAGSGTELAECQELASSIKNTRIIFHSPWKNEETSKLLAAADVLLLPTRGDQSLSSVPSKLLSYMLSAKPVLAMVLAESDTAQVIKEADCGWVIPPDDVDLLEAKILQLSQASPSELLVKGQNGRKFAAEHFTTNKLLPKVIEVIENTIVKGKK